MSVASEPGTQHIYTEETPRRHAPVAESGVIGWIHHNLFRTPFDIVLTIISAIIVYAVVTSAVKWAVVDANWFAITRNLSLFMLGPMQADPVAVTNVQIMTLLLAFAVGMSFAAWAYIGLRSWVFVAILAVVCLVLPPVIASSFELPPSVLAVGNNGIVSGSVTETPIDSFAFIASEGETFIIESAASADEVGLTGVAAFTDRATDALVNASRARLEALARRDEIEASLADANLPERDAAALRSELSSLSALIDNPIRDAYAINEAPVAVRLLRGDAETVIYEGTIAPGDAPIEVTLPTTGWYVLEKSIEGEGVSLITLQGMYPLLERSMPQPLRDQNGNIILGPNGQPRTQSVTQYLRIVDELIVEQTPPRRDGADVRRFLVIDNQYRGERPLSDFLVLHVGPFLERLNRALIPALLLVFIGYIAGKVLDGIGASVFNLVERYWRWLAMAGVLVLVLAEIPRVDINTGLLTAGGITLFAFITVAMLRPNEDTAYIRQFVSWLWFFMPFFVFFLVVGTDVGRWGGLFLTFMLTAVGIVASFPIGVLLALGRRADELPVVKYLCIAFIETVRGVPLITVLFLASLALPLVNPAFSTVPGAVRAMVAITLFSAAYLAENVRGGLQSIPPGQAEAARALGMNPVQVTLFITLPQALRAVIPALVGQCISLFKDTSLVAIVGLIDLTKSADSVVAQPEYLGLRREAYLFISIVYFAFSYFMGYVSRKIEESGSGRARQTKL